MHAALERRAPEALAVVDEALAVLEEGAAGVDERGHAREQARVYMRAFIGGAQAHGVAQAHGMRAETTNLIGAGAPRNVFPSRMSSSFLTLWMSAGVSTCAAVTGVLHMGHFGTPSLSS